MEILGSIIAVYMMIMAIIDLNTQLESMGIQIQVPITEEMGMVVHSEPFFIRTFPKNATLLTDLFHNPEETVAAGQQAAVETFSETARFAMDQLVSIYSEEGRLALDDLAATGREEHFNFRTFFNTIRTMTHILTGEASRRATADILRRSRSANTAAQHRLQELFGRSAADIERHYVSTMRRVMDNIWNISAGLMIIGGALLSHIVRRVRRGGVRGYQAGRRHLLRDRHGGRKTRRKRRQHRRRTKCRRRQRHRRRTKHRRRHRRRTKHRRRHRRRTKHRRR